MALVAHMTTGYAWVGVFGLATQIRVFAGAGQQPSVELAAFYALVLCLWSVFNTEYWKRKERFLALSWGTIGFEAAELVRPQFKGIKMMDAVTGRPGEFFPPRARRASRAARR